MLKCLTFTTTKQGVFEQSLFSLFLEGRHNPASEKVVLS